MVFSSIIFLLLFLPVTLTLYYAFGARFRNAVLLLASLLFYAWGEGGYLILMLVSITLNYLVGRFLAGSKSPRRRRWYLTIGVVLNLMLLGYFKYGNLLVDTFTPLISGFEDSGVAWEPIHLPIGISFFTFQAMSYIIDVYRNTARPQKNPLRLGLYIASFPQLIAGPIVRYNQVAEQLVRREHSYARFASGVERFIVGLGKKVLIANTMAEMADRIFAADYSQLSPEIAWLGLICYTLQIYFDFSGYSDMAIGLGRMFGFDFPENFNHPYISRSIREFWRRWHLSLSGWFRDYLYIPLGGSHRGGAKTYRNLFTVFVLCGFWHGASWNFLIWGLFHGMFLALERKVLKNWLASCSRLTGHVYFIFLLINSWLFFRVEDTDGQAEYLKAMYFMGDNPGSLVNAEIKTHIDMFFVCMLILGVVFSMPAGRFVKNKICLKFDTYEPASVFAGLADGIKYLGLFCLLYISVSFLTVSSYNPFIYFRF